MKILTLEWDEKIEQNRKQYTSVKCKVITSHCLSQPKQRDQHVLLSVLKKWQGGSLHYGFLRISWRVDLPHQHPWGSSASLSLWVLSKTKAAQPMELYSDEYKSEAVLTAHRWHIH